MRLKITSLLKLAETLNKWAEEGLLATTCSLGFLVGVLDLDT